MQHDRPAAAGGHLRGEDVDIEGDGDGEVAEARLAALFQAFHVHD
jgi:hypothetical protein